MGNLFVVYGDILSKKMLSLADAIALPAFGGKIEPQDELTERFFELSGEEFKKEISDKYGSETLGKGDLRVINDSALIETAIFVHSVYEPIWSLSDPETERQLLAGYHNPLSVAFSSGNKSMLLPYIGMSLEQRENEYIINRITKMMLKKVSGNRRAMDIYLVIPKWLGLHTFKYEHTHLERYSDWRG